MQKLTPEEGRSTDLVSENVERLKELFPDVYAEGGIDFDILRQLLGDVGVLDEGEEKFGFNWHGKKKARHIALTPSTGTLLPCPEESVDWDTTKNIFIEGDNLQVLKLLQKSYANKIKMIYIDPPYNRDKDFIYPDKFQEDMNTYLRYTGQIDDEGFKLSSDTEKTGRRHTRWINMIYPRLKLAKSLLKRDGVIFISIDDREVNYLRTICNEIFGEENFVAQIVWQKSKKGDSKLIAVVHEYILCYTKDKISAIESGIWRLHKKGVNGVLDKYQSLRQKYEANHVRIREEMMAWYRGLKNSDPQKSHKHYNWSDENGLYFAADLAGPDDGRKNRPRHDILHPATGKSCKKPSTGWRWDKKKTEWAMSQSPPRIHFGDDETTVPNRKIYLEEASVEPFGSHFYQDGRTATLQVEELLGDGVFQFPKNTSILSKLINLVTEKNDIILDFYAGSGSTAHACFELNHEANSSRRFILVQLPELLDSSKNEQKAAFQFCANRNIPENIAEVSKERIRRSGESFTDDITHDGLDIGFRVFKLSCSNIHQWNPNRDDIEESLISHEDHLIDGRSEHDILYEILLKRGIDLAISIESKKVGGKTVYSADHGQLFACLSKSITTKQVEKIGQCIVSWHQELAPEHDSHIFFRDSAFKDDISKTNMVAILEQNGLPHVRSL